MLDFKALASKDATPLTKLTSRIEALRVCSTYIDVFLNKSKEIKQMPPEFQERLIKRNQDESEKARLARGEANAKTRELKEAPDKIKALSAAHKFACL